LDAFTHFVLHESGNTTLIGDLQGKSTKYSSMLPPLKLIVLPWLDPGYFSNMTLEDGSKANGFILCDPEIHM
jgi:hypothetical protein